MIRPFQKNDELLEDIETSREDQKCLHVWWLGQSGFLIKWGARRLLFDPYLSDSLSLKYAETDKPHVRMTELVVDPSQIGGLDVITSSHNHTDHLDKDTLLALARANPGARLVLPKANIGFAEGRLGTSVIEMIGLNDGVTLEVGPFQFTGSQPLTTRLIVTSLASAGIWASWFVLGSSVSITAATPCGMRAWSGRSLRSSRTSRWCRSTAFGSRGALLEIWMVLRLRRSPEVVARELRFPTISRCLNSIRRLPNFSGKVVSDFANRAGFCGVGSGGP